LGGGRGWLRVGLGVVCANPVVGFVYTGGCTRRGRHIYVSGLFWGWWTPVWVGAALGSLRCVEASLPCSRFVLFAAAPAPLGFCAGGGGPSDG